tara:strand:+ start:874 stop:1293 length:420 start_codon:yes stop_codon:yes gene_type:complete
MNELIKQVAISETKNVMSRAIKRFSKEKGNRIIENQLTIRLKDSGDIVFHRCFLYEEVEKLTFNEVLDVKVDFKGREGLASPFMQKSIIRLAEEHDINDKEDIKIYCFTLDEKAKKVLMYAYHKNEKLKQITWNYLFDD